MTRHVLTALLLLLALCGVRAQDEPKPQPADSVIEADGNHAVVEPFTHIDYKPLVESSGLQYWQGAWWSHNDSGGAPVLYRGETPDFKGAHPYSVKGAKAVDWEEITVIGDDLLVCDIGDNHRRRDDLMLYRVAWNADTAELSLKAKYPVAYPDGSHDAEAVAVVGGKLTIVTKHRGEGFTGVYQFNELKEGETNTPEFVGKLDIDEHTMITAADYDAERKKLVLLSYTRIFIYGDKLEGKPERSLLLYAQQCESLCLHDGAVYYGNEQGEIFKVDNFLGGKYESLLPPRVKAELPVAAGDIEPDGSGESWKEGAFTLPLASLNAKEYLRWKVCGAYLMLAGRFDYDSFNSSSETGDRLGSALMVMIGREETEFLKGDELHLWLGDNGVTGVDAWKLDPEKFTLSVLPGAKCSGEVKAKVWTFEYAIPLTQVFGEGELPARCVANVWAYNVHGRGEPHLAGDTLFCFGNPYVWADVGIKQPAKKDD
ncbi:MAG: hypothetical protein KDB82_04545 [Planctomycetes bacterium]|nr:hypothetical protein [Planctomycetota bacterium]